MPFTGNEIHDIDWTDAAPMTKRYRDANLNKLKGGFFGRAAIEKILAQPNCVGIRFYFALDDQAIPNMTVVLSGALANEDDIDGGHLAEFAKPCPNQCGKPNVLNGL